MMTRCLFVLTILLSVLINLNAESYDRILKLKIAKKLKRVKKAKLMLKNARKQMNRINKKTVGKRLKDGWRDPKTILYLERVMQAYPESHSAISAKLRIAIILMATHAKSNTGYKICEQIYQNYPKIWPGKYAKIYTNKNVNEVNRLMEQKDWKGLIKMYRTQIVPILIELERENDQGYRDFEKDMVVGEGDSFLVSVYENLLGFYLNDNDIQRAKSIARKIVHDFPSSNAARRTKGIISMLENGHNPRNYSGLK